MVASSAVKVAVNKSCGARIKVCVKGDVDKCLAGGEARDGSDVGDNSGRAAIEAD